MLASYPFLILEKTHFLLVAIFLALKMTDSSLFQGLLQLGMAV